jgi:hypothetical protein
MCKRVRRHSEGGLMAARLQPVYLSIGKGEDH